MEVNYFFPHLWLFQRGNSEMGVYEPPARVPSRDEASPAGIPSLLLPPVERGFVEVSGSPRLQSNPSSSWRLRTASRARLRGFDFTQGSLSPLLSLLLFLSGPSPQFSGAKRSFLVGFWCWEARRVLRLTQGKERKEKEREA